MHRNARCVGMVYAAYFIWPSATQYCEPTFFFCFKISFPFHFTCLAVKSKEQNGAFVIESLRFHNADEDGNV